ncbi:uncharacterized protein MELLADRAFT_74280 [Melampsora larici-populina 98AG31]|uniref:Uncharacterized protein n=1 Tax=Melampsora larici-populina (strain 98AG31 / pathotype 3-4-7) TaxID=747676 RepID=F4RCP6_MELLP|nr:uncharacterized protein MELLADRAFT_74280 [Melampsora larici-populina 98AG31]EGG10011.1 hypothetical protein MELLADRAFT_74280 [Melampsora larici-populina 98AG31]
MKQANEMMSFEIDYKIFVRDLALRPIPSNIHLENPKPEPQVSSSTSPAATDPISFTPTLPAPSSAMIESSVILRPGGYKRYTLPPPPAPPVSVPSVSNQTHHSNNPLMYTTSLVEIPRRRILPKPSLFSSSFFIWQKTNLS